MSRKQRILRMFNKPDKELTCAQITNYFIKKDKLTGNIAHYLSASISTILRKLVLAGILTYSARITKRKGHIYLKVYETTHSR